MTDFSITEESPNSFKMIANLLFDFSPIFLSKVDLPDPRYPVTMVMGIFLVDETVVRFNDGWGSMVTFSVSKAPSFGKSMTNWGISSSIFLLMSGHGTNFSRKEYRREFQKSYDFTHPHKTHAEIQQGA